MKAYFYCRVAHDDSFSLEQQVAKLRRYAEQAGYTIVGVAAEHGSGMTLDRPALQEVMEAVLAGKVDVVLISSLDRIEYSLQTSVAMVKPGGTGIPIRFISARLAPLPPSLSLIWALPSACPLPKV